MDTSVPLSSAITKSLRVDVPSGTTGSVGVSNTGYFGIPVPATTMTAAGFIQGDFSGTVTLSVVSAADGTVFGTTDLVVDSNSTAFTPFTTTFTTTAAPDGNNVFDVTFDATAVAGSSLWFDLLQLFPVTFKNRANGLRPDIAQALDNVNASFLRLPGGNNL
jgi:alpha-N-arabinofuranosidase